MRNPIIAMTAAFAGLLLPGATTASATTLYVSPIGWDGADCAAGAPCQSFERAYRLAAPGDVVEVAGGSYGAQRLPSLNKPTPAVEVRAAMGADVHVADFTIGSDHIVVRGINSDDSLTIDDEIGNDTVDDVKLFDVTTHKHYVVGARDFTWTRGSIGPAFNTKASMIGGTPTSYRLTYDGVVWHDATRDAADVHTECLLALGVQGLTIRNSRFTNCAVFDLFVSKIGDDPVPRDILLENNVFERSRDVDGSGAYYTIMAGAYPIDGWIMRNNVWELPWSFEGATFTSSRLTGNIGPHNPTCAGLKYSHNVWTDRTCGSTDRLIKNAMSQFVNPGAANWRLKPGAAAIDAGDPGDAPATDADGFSRPVGKAPDAGAYEFGATAPGAAPLAPVAAPAAPDLPPGIANATATPAVANPVNQLLTPLVRAGKISRRRARVVDVIDGETLRVRFGTRRRATVQLLGISAPARPRTHRRGECGGTSATSYLRSMVFNGRRGAIATLYRDPKRSAADKRGRLQAYAAVAGKDLGQLLLGAGYAKVPLGSDLLLSATYQAAGAKAKAAKAGLWKRCG